MKALICFFLFLIAELAISVESPKTLKGRPSSPPHTTPCRVVFVNFTERFSKTDINILRSQAQDNNAESSYQLGDIHFHGKGVPQNYEAAFPWLLKAAELEHPTAQFQTGLMYDHGWGVPQDFLKALHWYNEASKQGVPEADNNAALMHAHGSGVPQDLKTARRLMKNPARQGIPEAQANLGWLYAQHISKPKRRKKALKWYNRAGRQNVPFAFHDLAFIAESEQDYVKAFKLHKKAAKLGFSTSQREVGLMLLSGIGTHKNYKKAAQWLHRAGQQKDPDALYFLGFLYEYEIGVPQDYSLAKTFYEQAGSLGVPDAYNQLGAMYLHGHDGVPQDYAEAGRLFKQAVEMGLKAPLNDLGYMHMHGLGVPQNDETAIELFKQAAPEEPLAMRNLATIYRRQKNDKLAAKWYKKYIHATES